MRPYPLLVANWKMYPTIADGIVLASGIKKFLENLRHLNVVLCPPALMIPMVHDAISSHKLPHLFLGAQNIHHLNSGAFTGEISASMLKGLVEYVIVGHSERIKWFHETTHETNLKVHAALKAGITPILAVGEPHQGKAAIKIVTDKLKGQLLDGLSYQELRKIVIAYEPLWAISTGSSANHVAATGDYAEQVAAAIRKLVGPQTRIIYGGSTTVENLADFLSQENLDGALVGASSVNLGEFKVMCEIASRL